MHRQVTVVSILMIVQGSLQVLMGGVYTVMGPVMMGIMSSAPTRPAPGGPDPETLMAGISIFYVVAGVLTLAAGVTQIIAGIRALKFRGRTMGIVAACLNLLSFGTCYCLPTGLGVMIYGLIVFLNAQSKRAFELGERGGMSADDIKATVDGEMRGGYPAAYPQQPPYGQQGPGPGGPPPPPPPGYGPPPGY